MKEINLIKILIVILFTAIMFFGGEILSHNFYSSNDSRKCYSLHEEVVFNACNGKVWVFRKDPVGFHQFKFYNLTDIPNEDTGVPLEVELIEDHPETD